MTTRFFAPIVATLVLAASLFSCNDNNIGSSITDTVLEVVVDSAYSVTGRVVENSELPARTITKMLGVIKAENYGELTSDVVTQFMPASKIDTTGVTIDDIDSCKFVFDIPTGGFTGDSVMPMRTTIYRLNKQLPSKISSTFNPANYYNPADVLGATTYTASGIMAPDSVKQQYLEYDLYEFTVDAPLALARELYTEYKKNPSNFLAPKDFANIFPGIYIENSFGSGRVMNIYNTQFIVYYRSHEKLENGNDTTYYRTQGYMGSTSEVISNNNMRLNVAQSVKDMIARGDMIVQSPAGYEIQIEFPIQEIINRFRKGGDSNIGVVNDLTFEIPVSNITNDYGIKPPTYLLMVKTAEKDDFFATNHKTDSKSSFYATYDNSTRSYKFTGMRNFVLDILNNKGGVADDSDKHFTLTPVDLIAENTSSSSSSYYYYYYYGTSASTSEIIGIRPALNKPSIARLDLDNAIIRFVFSTQSLRQ
ncbi:MAG: DUF4270 family protein [Muribaculaceae bacterium]